MRNAISLRAGRAGGRARRRWRLGRVSCLPRPRGSNSEIAQRLGVSRTTVWTWRSRFVEDRLDGLVDEPRPGRPRTVTDAQVEEVIVRTLETTPRDATHWSTRSMAREVGTECVLGRVGGARVRRREHDYEPERDAREVGAQHITQHQLRRVIEQQHHRGCGDQRRVQRGRQRQKDYLANRRLLRRMVRSSISAISSDTISPEKLASLPGNQQRGSRWDRPRRR